MIPRILLVEDNEELAAGIVHNLEMEGYEVRWEGNGEEGLRQALSAPPDLLILDIMLPGLDGFGILRQLRANRIDTPVLVLTARGEEADRVRGFRLDADQYVTKPFSLLELLERVRSLLRRSLERGSRADGAQDILQFGDVTVDVGARTVSKAGKPVPLTPKAFDLLVALACQEGRVLSRQELLQKVWGHRAAILTRTVDSHVSELRQKLEDDPSAPNHVHTVWKIGYRFES